LCTPKECALQICAHPEGRVHPKCRICLHPDMGRTPSCCTPQSIIPMRIPENPVYLDMPRQARPRNRSPFQKRACSRYLCTPKECALQICAHPEGRVHPRVLSGCCQDVVRMLSGCCQDVVWLLAGCCQDVVRTLSGCLQDILRMMLSVCCEDVVRMMSGYLQDNVVRMLSGCCRDDVRLFEKIV